MDERVVLHLIRHEKTQANVERKYIGWTDEPILPDSPSIQPIICPEVIYGSDLMRCEQTAKAYFPHATFIGYEDFREYQFGDFEMKTYAQLQHNANYRRWIDDPLHCSPLNGETFFVFENRVLQGVATIILKPSTYTFVTHGGMIRLLLSTYLGQDFQQIHAEHRKLYTLSWDSFQAFKEGQRCTSFSVVPLTANNNL